VIFVGDDWSEDHHDVYVMDEAGERLGSRRLPEGPAGISKLHELIAVHATQPEQVVIGIEIDRGLWVSALSAAGFQVYAINPMAVARYRDRHHVSRAKSDASDAKLLADLVRTDRHNHRPIAGDSAAAEAIKVLARGHQSLIWTRTRHTNALRSALREYYPAALVAFEDLADRDALAILGRAPTPEQGGALSLSAIRSALKRAGRQRYIDARARDIQAALRSEQLVAPTPVAAAFAATTRAAVGIITELNRQISDLETALAANFESHPDADIYLSQPGLGDVLGARVLGEFGDDPNRYTDAKSRKNYAGTSPLTVASGKNAPCWPATCATSASTTRSTCGHSVPYRPAPAPAPSTTNTAPPAIATTRPYAYWVTASSASCTAAYATTPTTTNTPPGNTELRLPLDI
jgi:transposase